MQGQWGERRIANAGEGYEKEHVLQRRRVSKRAEDGRGALVARIKLVNTYNVKDSVKTTSPI